MASTSAGAQFDQDTLFTDEFDDAT